MYISGFKLKKKEKLYFIPLQAWLVSKSLVSNQVFVKAIHAEMEEHVNW